jgi:hypothetical protein
LKSKQGKNKASKNKIYFIWKLEKVPYLCTPNRKEAGKSERRMSGRYKKKIEAKQKHGETKKTFPN